MSNKLVHELSSLRNDLLVSAYTCQCATSTEWRRVPVKPHSPAHRRRAGVRAVAPLYPDWHPIGRKDLEAQV